MTEQEYDEEIRLIEAEATQKKHAVYRKYAKDQEKFKVGDIIKDERWAFEIDKITAGKSFGLPQPVYHGFELKKDLTPKKNNNRVCIYGNNGVILIKPNNYEPK